MKIIPAIDILDGKCVRLFQGDYSKVEVFNNDPLLMATELQNAGFQYLHLVDLNGAKSNGNNLKYLQQIAKKTTLKIDFGGGLRTMLHVDEALKLGANQVNIGSMAVKNPAVFEDCLTKYGNKIIWNADLKNGKIAIEGWRKTVADSFFNLVKKYHQKGLRNILTTDVSKDGALEGPNFKLYRDLVEKFPQINWIASGGITTASDVHQLKKDRLYGAVVGKAMYKGLITYKELLEVQYAD